MCLISYGLLSLNYTPRAKPGVYWGNCLNIKKRYGLSSFAAVSVSCSTSSVTDFYRRYASNN